MDSPHKGPVTRSFDVFFDLRLHKWLSKQSGRQWFDTPSCSLWRHCNDDSKIVSNSWSSIKWYDEWEYWRDYLIQISTQIWSLEVGPVLHVPSRPKCKFFGNQEKTLHNPSSSRIDPRQLERLLHMQRLFWMAESFYYTIRTNKWKTKLYSKVVGHIIVRSRKVSKLRDWFKIIVSLSNLTGIFGSSVVDTPVKFQIIG